MPSLGDSAVIILLGLLLFGPKGLAQIARQLGKLMGEFRRASNEFRMQMEEELRLSEQADRQKQIAAIEAAAPVPPLLTSSSEEEVIDHPHLHAAPADTVIDPITDPISEPPAEAAPEPVADVHPLPIATSGALNLMPPATGLPTPRSSPLGSLLNAVPRVEASNGHVEAVHDASEQKPMRHTNHHEETKAAPVVEATDAAITEPVHG